jgi:hypothetical protein
MGKNGKKKPRCHDVPPHLPGLTDEERMRHGIMPHWKKNPKRVRAGFEGTLRVIRRHLSDPQKALQVPYLARRLDALTRRMKRRVATAYVFSRSMR